MDLGNRKRPHWTFSEMCIESIDWVAVLCQRLFADVAVSACEYKGKNYYFVNHMLIIFEMIGNDV